MSISLDVQPVIQSLRRIPLSRSDEVSAELGRLESDGIIEKTESSPWVSNIVVVRKKSGSIRPCVDLRQVNKSIIPGKYSLPTVDELASELILWVKDL